MTGLLRGKTLTLLVGLALLLSVAGPAIAASLKLKVAEKEPPAELDASIRGTLQASAVQLLDGDKPVFEFWFRTEVPLTAAPASTAKAMDALKPATLFGVVALGSEQRDYKDNAIAPGVHTLRFALQPQDGNHLGSADFAYFLVLVSAKLDPKLDGIADYKTLVKASASETSTEHPVILSLRPVNSASGEAPALNEPAPEHKAIRLKLPAKAGSGDKSELVFDLVYEGKGHI